jgi:hypothetical protein
MIRAVLFLVFLTLTACSTGVLEIENLNLPINDIHRVIIIAMPVRIRAENPNGREFFSAYFLPKKGDFEESDGGPVRYVTRIEILGDEKPYTIDVAVKRERRVSENHYETDQSEEGIARVVIRRIQKALHERRDDRNVIDDFRVF